MRVVYTLGLGFCFRTRVLVTDSRFPKLTLSNVFANGIAEGIVPTGGHGKTERRNFRVRSRGWGHAGASVATWSNGDPR